MVVQRSISDSGSNELEDSSLLKDNEMVLVGEKRKLRSYRNNNCSLYIVIAALVVLCIVLSVGLLLKLIHSKSCQVIISSSKRSNSNSIVFFWLSDIHFDIYYNKSISTLTSCRSIQTKNDTIYPISSPYESLYGRPGCDTSLELLKSTANEIQKINANIKNAAEFILVTGDQAAHDYDLFQVDVKQSIFLSAKKTLNELSSALLQTPIFLAMGNNDIVHDYQPPVKVNDSFYKNYAEIMEPFMFISADVVDNNAKSDFRKTFYVGGYYKVYIKEASIILLVINTNYWITKAYENNRDVVNIGNIQMGWLITQLKEAQLKNKKVIIAGHIPPGCSSYELHCNMWLSNYTDIYLNITTRVYKNVIAVQFYGHTHQDKIKLLYQSQIFPPIPDENMKSYMLLAPSITPVYRNNPAFRLVTFNEDRNIADYDQFYFDLVLSNVLQKPVWYKEYSFCNTYNSSSITMDASENLVHSLVQEVQTWLSYFKHMLASYGSKSSSQRFIEYCSSMYLTSKPFSDCINFYKVKYL
ncbi:sphingomyelinase phosphodiesterase D isoform X1 [Hydra vulgaris]|uniref:Sphingomyelinase phosphodiesterase D isoform X1 n=1 Tax=Hydra vulgaris TaxID=6087 RepID=A0ABM4DIB7_HYDVU